MDVVDFLTVIEGEEPMDVTFAGRILDFTPSKSCIMTVEVGKMEEKRIIKIPIAIDNDTCARWGCCVELSDYIGHEAIFKGNWNSPTYNRPFVFDGVAIK